MAALYVSQSDLENARRCAQMAVDNSRLLCDVWQEQSILAMSGTIKHAECDWAGAIGDYEAALALAVEIGDRAVQAALEVNVGIAHANLGNLARAEDHLANGLNQSQQNHLRIHELKGQLAVARLRMRLSDWESAAHHLEAAEKLVEMVDTPEAELHLPLLLSARAELTLATGNMEEAMTLAEASVDLAIEQEKQVDRAICQRVKSQVLMARGHYRQAEVLLEQSLPLLEGRHGYEAAKIKVLLGHCLLKSGDTVRGDEFIEEARSAFEVYGAKFDLAELAKSACDQVEQRSPAQ
jgi:tetratricopeptide (TPR) repeat protein